MRPTSGDPRWALNKAHWQSNLDVRNLRRGGAARRIDREVKLYETVDVRWAMDALEPLSGRWVADLGGGLALSSILLAHRGARVLLCDLSVPRLRAARELLVEAGVQDKVHLVACRAEDLPFRRASVDRLFTKSVLIHTDLPRAATECGRILSGMGKAAFIEPLRKNPLVKLYRRLFAPGIWRDITTYFGPAESRVLCRSMRHVQTEASSRFSGRFFYLTGFLGSAFHYLIPSLVLRDCSERVFGKVDDFVFRRFPASRNLAWFCVFLFERKEIAGGRGRADTREV